MLLIRDSCGSNILSLFLLLSLEEHVLLDCTSSRVHMAAAEGHWLEPDLSSWGDSREHSVCLPSSQSGPGHCASPTRLCALCHADHRLAVFCLAAPKTVGYLGPQSNLRDPMRNTPTRSWFPVYNDVLGSASKPVFNPFTLPHWFWIILA